MDSILQDVRWALRSLRRAPMHTAAAIACLALGIGVNTTMFSSAHNVFLEPFPYTRPQELVVLSDRREREANSNVRLSYANLLDWKAGCTAFAQVAGVGFESFTLAGSDEPARVDGAAVDAGMFPMLGVAPALGRGFTPADDRVGAPPVALLSDPLWRERWQADPHVVGRTLQLDGRPHTVIGVMPPNFEFPFNQRIWVPLAPRMAGTGRDHRFIMGFARLAPGVTLADARARVGGFAARLARAHTENRGWTTRVRPLREVFMPDSVRLMVAMMMGAVWCVLLIACVNVANLMLARAASRQREVAIRAAVGASRGRIVRQMLIESVVIGMAGGALGALLAAWGVDLMHAVFPPGVQLPYYVTWHLDRWSLVYTALVSILTGILFGVVPALRASRPDLHSDLKDGARGSESPERVRVRSTLVIAQIALTLVCLVGAALFARSMVAADRADMGFDVGHLLTLRVDIARPELDAIVARTRAVDELVRRVRAVPGVAAAAASNVIALGNGGLIDEIVVDGHERPAGEEPRVFIAGVTSGWLATLGVPLVRGRDLTAAEAGDSAAVAVVNEAAVRALWPGGAAIGSRFRLLSDPSPRWVTVVGVAPDFHVEDVDESPRPAMFLPWPYHPSTNIGLTVRATGDPRSISGAVRRAVRATEPTAPVTEIQTMAEVRRLAAWGYPFFTRMFGAFGVIALLLAVFGLYGVVAYGVSQRTHEIGVRLAFGAMPRDIVGLVLMQGLRLAVAGVVVGALLAVGFASVMRTALFGTSPADPVSFLVIGGFLVASAAIATAIPAARAAHVDPAVALRHE